MQHQVRSPLTLASTLALCLPVLACGGSDPNTTDATLSGITDSNASLSNTTDETSGATQTMTDTDPTATDTDPTATDTDPTATDTDPTATDTDPTATDTDPTATDTDPSDSGPSIQFDLTPLPDSPDIDTSCGMVDFLFVIDNSGSMSDEQNSLIANFPAFIQGIEMTLETVDSYHVGVVTTDAYGLNTPGCNTLGQLVTKSSSGMCGPYAEGFNFMTEADNLGQAFACAALVGTNGSATERPMEAMMRAVDGTYGGMGQCNYGFIREDALLVIVIITDEPDNASVGQPVDWYNTVVAAKFGIPENVVIVSIINTPNGMCGSNAVKIADFTNMFGINGFMSDICGLNFGPIFDQAVAIIDVACDNYLQN